VTTTHRHEGHDVALVRAANPGPFTLSGTNTWIVGRDPAWVIDPGPRLDAHLDAVAAEVARRGGAGGIVLTHGHADHAEGVPALRDRLGHPPVAAARGDVDIHLADGGSIGPFTVHATPGHAADHLAYVAGSVAFTGDAVLGEGSVFITPDPGALAGYLDGLRRLRGLELTVIHPGHGPTVDDPATRLDDYIAHRLERERRLLDALDRGLRTSDDLLDDVWADAPAFLRPAAAVTLRAHLDKLADDGRLPGGVQRPELPGWLGGF
jgi:glyoxylase-like metal-dependent hydrolase (beta-lactamase superfamily II)